MRDVREQKGEVGLWFTCCGFTAGRGNVVGCLIQRRVRATRERPGNFYTGKYLSITNTILRGRDTN